MDVEHPRWGEREDQRARGRDHDRLARLAQGAQRLEAFAGDAQVRRQLLVRVGLERGEQVDAWPGTAGGGCESEIGTELLGLLLAGNQEKDFAARGATRVR